MCLWNLTTFQTATGKLLFNLTQRCGIMCIIKDGCPVFYFGSMLLLWHVFPAYKWAIQTPSDDVFRGLWELFLGLPPTLYSNPVSCQCSGTAMHIFHPGPGEKGCLHNMGELCAGYGVTCPDTAQAETLTAPSPKNIITATSLFLSYSNYCQCKTEALQTLVYCLLR